MRFLSQVPPPLEHQPVSLTRNQGANFRNEILVGIQVPAKTLPPLVNFIECVGLPLRSDETKNPVYEFVSSTAKTGRHWRRP